MKLGCLVLLFFISLYCWADVFKSIDSQGNIVYSDTPLNDHAERIELPADEQSQSSKEEPTVSTKTTVTESGATTAVSETTKTKKPYTKFSILSPTNQATLQNQPIIFIEIGVDPSLQKGDMVQIYLDGSPWGSPAHSTHFQFTRPDRGTHQISAKLMDERRQMIKETDSYTIYIHQAHLGTSSPG